MKRNGFTLIELLVVIAIIVIIAAILFPVFATAREKGQQATCESNEKQLAMGVLQYIQDYDMEYPETGVLQTPAYTFAWGSTWAEEILPYMTTLDVYRCPDDTLVNPSGSANWIPAGDAISYSVNAMERYNSAFGFGYGNQAGPFGYVDNSTNSSGELPHQSLIESQINKPDQTIMLAEVYNKDTYTYCTANKSTGCPTVNAARYYAYPLQWQASIGWGAGANSDFPDGGATTSMASTTDPTYNPKNPNGNVSAHHPGGLANFAFCDGHVHAMQPYMTDPNAASQPQNNMWDARRP